MASKFGVLWFFSGVVALCRLQIEIELISCLFVISRNVAGYVKV